MEKWVPPMKNDFQSWKKDWIGYKGLKEDLVSLLNLTAIIILLPIIIPVFAILFIEGIIILIKEKREQKDILSRGHKE